MAWCGGTSPFFPSSIVSSSANQLIDPAFALKNTDVTIELENAALWNQFHKHGTEMIVTKNGRRMFPTLRYTVKGLDPNGTYAMFVEMVPADEWRYKFSGSRWVVSGTGDPMAGDHRTNLYSHPDSPASGRLWMKQPVSFHRLKLTNNPIDQQGHVLLYSMHKYQPVLLVVRLHEFYPGNGTSQLVAKGVFQDSSFYAVTAYQNEKVIQLKINNNPFAKGFRETGKHEKNKADSPIHSTPSPSVKRLKESPVLEEKQRDAEPSSSTPAKIEPPVTPEDAKSTQSLPLPTRLTYCPTRNAQTLLSIRPNLSNRLLPPFSSGILPALSYYVLPPAVPQTMPFSGVTVYPYLNWCSPQFTGHYGFPYGI